MNFDKSSSKSSNGAGIVLTFHDNGFLYFSFRLNFEATNNIAECESLLDGLNVAKDLGIKLLKIVGDFDLVVFHVKGIHLCKNEKLKRYMQAIILAMELFEVIGLEVVPLCMNNTIDSLAVSMSLFQTCPELEKSGRIEPMYRPSMPYTVEN